MKENLPIHYFANKKTQFHLFGYEVHKGNNELWKKDLRNPFEKYLKEKLLEFNKKFNLDNLENYHEVFINQENLHHDFIKKISRNISSNIINPQNKFFEIIKSNVEKLFNKEFEVYEDRIEFRVVRPHQPDNNLLHRDHWFPYFTPLLNLYIPLSGSNYSSVLKIVPESHKWSDEDVIPSFGYKEGKRLGKNGILYSTPTIKESKKKIIEHKPDVLEGDYMIFSPLIVHGGGANSGNQTRFSLEVRLKAL